MEIKFATTSRGVPQFVVTAKTEEDMAAMVIFLSYPYKRDMIFWLHGQGSSQDPSEIHFNFGWIDQSSTVRAKRTWWQHLKKWFSK